MMSGPNWLTGGPRPLLESGEDVSSSTLSGKKRVPWIDGSFFTVN